MKVCILSHCFFPSQKRGGPTVSVTNMVKNLADSFELSVVTIIYDKNSDKPYDNVNLGKNRLFGADVFYLNENNFKAFYSSLSQIKPDVIYVSSLFSYQYSLAALMYAKKNSNVRIIIAPRGELMPLALNRKWLIKRTFLSFVKFVMRRDLEFHITSDEEEIALKKYFSNNKVWKINNLPSKVSEGLCYRDKSVGSLNVAIIGRIHPIKNIHYAIELMQYVKGDVVVSIYGPEENQNYFEHCVELSKTLPKNIQVIFKGAVPHEKIGQALCENHILLSPTKSENYGHSIVESLLCGVPVIISNNTPWHNLECNYAGFDINLIEKEKFCCALQEFVDMDYIDYCIWCKGARTYIESELSVNDTVEQYVQMLLEK